MQKIDVHVIFEHGGDLKPYGCAYIRDLLPLTHPVNEEGLTITKGIDYSKADVIVVERMWKPNISLHLAETLVEQIRKDKAIFIYSIDDNLLDLEYIPIEARMAMQYFCRAADGILVSTEFLKKRLSRLNKRIIVLPNALDERLFGDDVQKTSYREQSTERKIIGYMGTFTHDADLLMILQPLREIMRKYSDLVEFQLLGGTSNPSVLSLFDGLPFRVLQTSIHDVEYPNFVSWMKKNLTWDIGIGPLEDTYFNRSKSDIKFLDYSALGIAGIYSDVPSYQETILHLETGYIVKNSPTDWRNALERLLVDDQFRDRLARNARDYVLSLRTLEHCGTKWRDAIFAIVEKTPIMSGF